MSAILVICLENHVIMWRKDEYGKSEVKDRAHKCRNVNVLRIEKFQAENFR